MKKCLLMLFVMGMVSVSQAVVIGDFEAGMDNWGPSWEGGSTFTIGSVPGTVTRGNNSVAVKLSDGGYWKMLWSAPSAPGLMTNIILTFDVTMYANEWSGNNWTKIADKIAFNSDSGWQEWTTTTAVDRLTGLPTSTDWGPWAGDAFKSYRLEIPSYNALNWFQIVISFQQNPVAGAGNFYIDNIQLIPEPTTMVLLGLGGMLTILRRRK